MAEIAGIDKDCLTAWSQRSTRLREWAKHNLVVVDGEPTPAQLATAQKATRPAKPESLAWETLKDQWRVTTARVRSSNVLSSPLSGGEHHGRPLLHLVR